MHNLSSIKTKWIIQYASYLLICISFAFSFLIIKDFLHPLVGFGDTEYWEYTGFYFSKNFNLLPFPNLNLINNQAFYPYGTNGVFQPWSIERDIFYAIFYSIFGIGSWIQIYYLLSVLVTGIGSFILLFKDYSFARASGAGFLISFFSFYAIHKYPEHLSYSIFHWTALSFIADFLILKRVTLGQYVSLRLILLRMCLLILSLGQELGYIAGSALTSFTISTIFTLLLLSYRYFRNKKLTLLTWLKITLRKYESEFYAYPRICLALLGLFLTASFIIFPLVLQISREAKSFDFTGIPSGVWWANPLRILIPFLPFFHPGQVNVEQLFNDSPEGLGAGSPGWFLLIIASVSLWQGRKQIAIFIPLLTIFFICIFYHPIHFPILKIFPWFAFSRVQGRFTVLYPIILSIFALNITLNSLRLHTRQLVSALLVFLACTEIYTAYSLKLNHQPLYSLDNSFFQYMNYVKEQPGEAVLDWPFCVIGGNGVGALQNLCPYYTRNGSIFALRRFHHKKVMGQYFGRLHPSQLKPYIEAGWDQMFVPNEQDIFKASNQKRCFNSEEWAFFTDFYKFNDFAGINLYVDFLPQDCVENFYTRFGTPTVETKVPGAGLVKFIPKSSELRDLVNLNLGGHLKLETFINYAEADLLKFQLPYGLNVNGLSTIETPSQGSLGRWGLGPETLLRFNLPASQSISLVFSFINPIEGQDIVVEANGVNLDKMVNLSQNTNIQRRLEFKGISGWNTVVFRYKDWNKGKVTFAPGDDRNMTVKFTQLAIEEK